MQNEVSQEEVIFRGLLVEICRRNGQSEKPYCRHRGAVAVLARQKDEILLVSQYRYAICRELLELPAGKLDRGEEPPIEAAKRELREETGMEAGRILPLGKIYSASHVISETLYLYYADDLSFVGEALDDGEFLSVRRIPCETLARQIAGGEIRDEKTVCAVELAKLKGYWE